jgi:YHS domain-containing protein
MNVIKDVVCEKELSGPTEFASKYGDQMHYFCSKKCQMDFVQSPLRYEDKSRSVSSTEGSPVTDAPGVKRPART